MFFNDTYNSITSQLSASTINPFQIPSQNNDNKEHPTGGNGGNEVDGGNGGDVKHPPAPSGENKTIIENFGDLSEMFTLNNMLFIIWFLVVYLFIYYFVRTFYRNDADPFKEKIAFSRGLDIFIFGLIIVLTIYSYWNLTEHDKQHLIGYLLNWTQDFYNNPMSFFNTLIFILLFYCFIYLFGVPMAKETRPMSIYLIEQKSWILLISVIIVDFFRYILGIPIIDIIFGLNGGLVNSWYKLKTDSSNNRLDSSRNSVDFSRNSVDISNNNTKPKKPEVFNIANSLYTYDDAQVVCKAYGARLATVDELNEAYDEGADWCVSSWSADRQVLFPTQRSTYDRLQNIKGAENNCGRTGVNGGRVEDTSMRFGINCYGIKPDPSSADKLRLNEIQTKVIPKSKEEVILDAKLEYWKNNKDMYSILNPFNTDKWSLQS
jgi:hypothetical protein